MVGGMMGPLSLSVTDYPLVRSPAPHLGHGGAPQPHTLLPDEVQAAGAWPFLCL